MRVQPKIVAKKYDHATKKCNVHACNHVMYPSDWLYTATLSSGKVMYLCIKHAVDFAIKNNIVKIPTNENGEKKMNHYEKEPYD